MSYKVLLIFVFGIIILQSCLPIPSRCQTTVEIEETESDKLDKMEQDAKAQLLKVGADLNDEEKQQLNIIQEQFDIYERSEGDRASLVNIDGTDRGIMEMSECEYLVHRHQQHIREWLIEKNPIHPYSKMEFYQADSRLFKAYRGNLSWGDWHNRIYDMSHWDKDFVKDYQKDCEDAEKAWIKYREAWAQLLKLIRRNELFGDKTIESSVKTSLTLERIEELK